MTVPTDPEMGGRQRLIVLRDFVEDAFQAADLNRFGQ
jgi:hypothetical protein